ncbi:nSTAND1 domain-containing NTPase, partial [Amycolatopsis lurida]|uniref:nSTAND1 domain-containing NTPase n=1 Tax=Amycolatopsis lurida TaxID=31959 RepID=UPI00365C2212
MTLAFVVACGGDRHEWEQRWHAAANALNEEVTDRDDGCVDRAAPYVGLTSYGQDDAERFFGRERLLNELLEKVKRRSFVAVFGPSGSGKSSLLRAGLIPRLCGDSDIRQVILFTPGPSPLRECARQLARRLGSTALDIEACLSESRDGLLTLMEQLLGRTAVTGEAVVVVDQFEEVFTLCTDSVQRAAFVDLLLRAASPDSRCRVVIGVRADFYSHCAQQFDLAAALQDAQVTVGPMSADELRRAITCPASGAGCAVESDLLSVLVAQTHGQAGALPLLSHALRETWRRRRGNTLTLAGYHLTGGLDGALGRTAERVFCSLTAPQQTAAQQLFQRLVALGNGTEDTKRRVLRRDLDDTPDMADTLLKLCDARMLTADREGVDLAHEALIHAWPRLRRWLDADREGHRLHREVTEAAAVWEDHAHDDSTLLRGHRLAVIEDWAKRADGLNQAERAFLRASIAARDHDQASTRRRIQRQRILIAVLAVLVLVAGTAVVYATRAQQEAERQRNAALGVTVALKAHGDMQANPRLAAQVALVAYRLMSDGLTA